MEKAKILIVDDEKDGRMMIKTILRQADYETYEAGNGEDALKLMRQQTPDLVLLDIQMPKKDGYQVCYEIRSDVVLMHIPVIMLTVMGDTIDKIRGLHLGIDDYITKPFETEEFLARINSVLKRRKSYEEVSMNDKLTGLYNNNFFKNQLKIFFNMAQRNKQPFSLAVIDIDKLKNINDKFGHTVGDDVLRKISAIMKDELRNSDIITRYDEDKFTILLPRINREQASIAMKKIKKRLKAENFIYPKTGETFGVSIKTGIADWNEDYSDEIQLFKAADSDMLKNKK